MAQASLSKPVVVVTGASRGIGKQLCFDFAAAGYDVACVARSSAVQPRRTPLPGTVEETAKGVEERGGSALALPLDVRDEAGSVALAQRIESEWGRCDVLINNAAVAPPRPALDDSLKRWRMAVDVNLNGPFYLIHAFRALLEAHGGRVQNVSSGASKLPEFGRASYTATKRALEGMSEALAHDLAGKVAVNCIRIDIPIWTEGYDATLPEDADTSDFEDPVIMSDACLWFARQDLSYTGHVVDLTELRERGVVRPRTRIEKR